MVACIGRGSTGVVRKMACVVPYLLSLSIHRARVNRPLNTRFTLPTYLNARRLPKQKPAEAEDETKQPTPPPDQWAEILGIPGEDGKPTKQSKSKKAQEKAQEKTKCTTPEKELSPKQLRSSKKEQPTPEKKSPIKSPPKKWKAVAEEAPQEEKKSKKTEKKKTDKKKRKKSEKE
ncbi:hypothetical protein ACJJTC_010808 [Scirpophaga incertulas]